MAGDIAVRPRSRWRRHLSRLLSVILIAGTSSIATRIWVWIEVTDAPLPALIADHHRTIDEANLALQQRLQSFYPAGTPEARLIRDLQSESPSPAFQLAGDWTATSRSALYTRTGFPCRYDWHISWTIDDQDRIVRLTGWETSICL